MHELLEANRLTILIPSIGYYPQRPSGSSRLPWDEAQYLAKRGHEVWLVAPDITGARREHTVEAGVNLLLYPVPRFTAIDPRRSFAHQRRTHASLLRHIGSKVDVIHGHAPLQCAGALAAYGPAVRLCYSVHSPVRLEMQAAGRQMAWTEQLRLAVTARLTHRVEHRCLRQAQAVTTDSSFTKGRLDHYHGRAIHDKTRVIPGWVNLNRFPLPVDRLADRRSLGWPTSKPVLFTLRRLVPRMGLDSLLRAARQLCSAGYDFHLIIGGGGPLLKQLQALRQELSLEDRVDFIGCVSEDDLPRMYAAADAFVLPTQALECFGLIVIEALACGTPVLATPVGAIPEIVSKVEPRWLAEDASAEALARLLQDFLDRKLPRHAPAVLRQVACQNYDQDKVLHELTTLALRGYQ